MTNIPAALAVQRDAVRALASAVTENFVRLLLEESIHPLVLADAMIAHSAVLLTACGYDEAALDITSRVSMIDQEVPIVR